MFILVLMIAPFYLNDLLFRVFQADYPKFISVMYITEFFAIGVCMIGIIKNHLRNTDLGFNTMSLKPLILWSIVLSLLGVSIDRTIGTVLYPPMKQWMFFHFPSYPNEYWRWFDLTFGIFLTALSEEVVFRGALLTTLRQRFSKLGAGFISITIFAGIHWGSGLNSMINAFVWAILPTFFVLRYRSIYPVLIAHFVTDFVAFYSLPFTPAL